MLEVFVLKIVTVNLKKGYKTGRILLKLLVFFLLTSITCHLSINAYFASDTYEAAVAQASEKRTIIIDAGHGGEDCGAIGVNGTYEKDLNLSIAKELGSLLSENGFAVVYTRTEDALLYTEEENIYGIRKISDLKNRCKIGAEYQNALFVSIHMNSYRSPECTGAQVYYSEKNGDSYKIATAVQSSIKSHLQNDNKRVIKPGKSIYLLENLDNPAILIECGFLTNPSECEKLNEKEYQKELSFSIFCGIIEYVKNVV